MIITKQKSFEEILESLRDEHSILLLGCEECATLCRTGGIEELNEMKAKLERVGKEVTACCLVHAPCQELGTRRLLRAYEEALNRAQGVLVLACGAGIQAVAEAVNILSSI